MAVARSGWMLLGLILALALSSGLAGAATAPVESVRSAIQQGLERIAADTARIADDPAAARELLERLYRPRADQRGIARFIAGKHWRKAEPASRERFTAALNDHLLRVYATAISTYAEPVAEFAREGDIGYNLRRRDDDRAVVRANVRTTEGREIAVDLHLHRRDGRWLVRDGRAMGMSLLLTYRATFAPLLAGSGLDGLSEQLERRASDHSPSSPDTPSR